MATDHAAKRAALTSRLSTLDADAERIKTKRTATEAQLAALAGKSESAAPVKAPKAPRRAKK